VRQIFPVSMDCPFLIAPSVFSDIYCLTCVLSLKIVFLNNKICYKYLH
jgi:hypothetical protein